MLKKTFAAALALGIATTALPATASAEVFDAPVPARQASESGLQTAIFAGGCFWGVEAVFSHTRGVTSAVSGYHGGTSANATYDRVSGGFTRHAEAVRVTYDPSVVRYDELLQILFSVVADPTLVNRQGPDRGAHYRAAIIPLTTEQRAVARSYINQMGRSGVWDDPIAVRVEDHQRFYEAEAYHQDFAHRNPNHGYIRRWDAPKIRALRANFPQLYRSRFRTG
ncbi:peptide-methionine (S)-S-oxide reductase MsrA [Aurantiacibacter aquimixticola]|uniref:Peptide methionine sulfoxide reductase MsrA n=1 Tax=Aurantiacibacter aquimixticola TaxID=1958945 RepID=A0A419RUT0_9SPHN|nr:peptide-methionine (S)-S-oxide reductase MsrA [Aurantiacibacter aquimixticola]RJY09504.1 peptide-methionine (S)-S-oxide reductase [Aurantiacibacter aquimixticola]